MDKGTNIKAALVVLLKKNRQIGYLFRRKIIHNLTK